MHARARVSAHGEPLIGLVCVLASGAVVWGWPLWLLVRCAVG
jgi:hypothetical protein